jgi:PPOX class probable F420-dependent enzyme
MAFDDRTAAGRHALQRLDEDRIAWLSTVTPEGQPQTFPIWFLWEDGEILIYSDQRARRNENIARNPRVSFHLADDGSGGDLVVIEGEAWIASDSPPLTDHPAYLAKYGAWIDEQLGGPAAMAARYNVPIRIRPTRSRATGA